LPRSVIDKSYSMSLEEFGFICSNYRVGMIRGGSLG